MKLAIQILLNLLLLAAPMAAQAQYTCTTNAGNTLTITGYSGPNGAVVIPAEINGLPVTGIGSGAFDDLGHITSVIIPDSVTSIGTYAFNYCTGLTNVVIGNGVTNIGQNAFYMCALTNITFGSSVTTIGTYAFENAKITVLTLPKSVTSIASSAFSYCNYLTNIFFGGNSPTNVSGAFSSDPATVYYLPGTTGWSNTFDGLPTVPFYTCTTNAGTLTITGYSGPGGAVAIPTNISGLPVTGIGNSAFSGSSVASVTIPNDVTSIGADAFFDCKNLKQVVIGDGVTAIGGQAFAFCSSLTNIFIPNSVTAIGQQAFISCTNVTGIVISDNITVLPTGVFQGCGMTNITIPPSVTSVQYMAFEQCARLTGVFCQGNAPSFGVAFDYGVGTTVYYLPGTSGWNGIEIPNDIPTVLWNPLIQTGDGSFGIRSNHFGFNVTGTTNIPLVIQACTNLASPGWTNLQTLNLTNGSYYFSEPVPAHISGRFYRISAY